MDEDTPPKSSCFTTKLRNLFCWDFCGTCRCTPSFQAVDADGRTIDLVRAFSPPASSGNDESGGGMLMKTTVILWKLLFLGLHIWAYSISVMQNPRPFFMAYATQWALVLSSFYSVCSLVNTVWPVAQPQPSNARVGWRIHTTWILFLWAASSELAVTILYWILLYKPEDGPPGTYNILSHAAICAACWVDGFVVNRIPIKLRHYTEITVWFYVVYLSWSVIQSLTNMGNPDLENQDTIYNVIDWRNDWQNSLVLSVVIILGLAPIIQLLMVGVSRLGRVYVKEEERIGDFDNPMGISKRTSTHHHDVEDDDGDVEMPYVAQTGLE